LFYSAAVAIRVGTVPSAVRRVWLGGIATECSRHVGSSSQLTGADAGLWNLHPTGVSRRARCRYLGHLGSSHFSVHHTEGYWGKCRMNIDDLLRIAMERRASDLHLKVGNYPHLRIDGELAPLTDQPRVSAEDMLTMAFSMMSARQKQKFKETTEIDMAYGVAGLGRFRV